jgi:transcriptional regulator with XRE-family HTH domain
MLEPAMQNETISEGLKRYSIGQKIRRLRLRKSMGLIQLGKHSGLSPALLSKLERNLMYPTLPTLLRIAMVFSVGLEYFFNPEPQAVVSVVRKRERLKFPEAPEDGDSFWFFECLDFHAQNRKLNAYLAEFQPSSATELRLHEHPGVEFMYVVQGKLSIHINEDEHQLAAGDAIYFESGFPHGYRRIGPKATTAVVVTTS